MHTAAATAAANGLETAEHATETRLVCFRIVYCLQVIPQLAQILLLYILLLLRESPVHRDHAVDGDEAHARAQR